MTNFKIDKNFLLITKCVNRLSLEARIAGAIPEYYTNGRPKKPKAKITDQGVTVDTKEWQ